MKVGTLENGSKLCKIVLNFFNVNELTLRLSGVSGVGGGSPGDIV